MPLQIDSASFGSFFFVLIVMFLLLVFSGFISSSEVAYFSLSKKDFDSNLWNSEREKNKVKQLLQNPKLLLATILILNNTVNICFILVSTLFIESYFTFSNVEFSLFDETYELPTKFLVLVVAISAFLLLFGEIIPKVYASKNSIKISKFSAPVLKIAIGLCLPISRPLLATGNFLEKRLKKSSKISVNQLNEVLQLTEEDKSTTEEEQKILKGIVDFGSRETIQIMTPRVDVFALSEKETFKNVLEKVSENGYSRIPVFDDNIDNIKGVLYAKDLLQHLDSDDYDWKNLVRQALFVPESKKLNDLLQDFKSKKIHLAIVVDEYGGTSGVVSLEDVIEEIVGDISDEFDEEEPQFTKIDDNSFVLEGKTALKNFYKILDIKNPEVFEESKGEAETLAGFVLEICEGFPKRRQTIDFDDYTFLIESLNQKRIKRIKVTRHNENKI